MRASARKNAFGGRLRQAKCSACPTRGWVKPRSPTAPKRGGRGSFPAPPLIEAHRAYNGVNRAFDGRRLGSAAAHQLFPSVCSWTQRMNCSFGTTIRLPTFSNGKPYRDPIQRLGLCMGRGGARERNGDPAVMPGGVERTLRRRASARIRWMGIRPAPVPRRRKLYITRFRPKGRKLVHSATPPLPGKTALLVFGPRLSR